MTCSCGRLRIGMELTENRNWNPSCQEHGLASEWYNSDEQRDKRFAQNKRLRELQALAREKRAQA